MNKTETDAARTALALLTSAVDDRDTEEAASDLANIIETIDPETSPFVIVALATLGASLAEDLSTHGGTNTRGRIQDLAITFESSFGVPSDSDEV